MPKSSNGCVVWPSDRLLSFSGLSVLWDEDCWWLWRSPFSVYTIFIEGKKKKILGFKCVFENEVNSACIAFSCQTLTVVIFVCAWHQLDWDQRQRCDGCLVWGSAPEGLTQLRYLEDKPHYCFSESPRDVQFVIRSGIMRAKHLRGFKFYPSIYYAVLGLKTEVGHRFIFSLSSTGKREKKNCGWTIQGYNISLWLKIRIFLIW